MEGDDAAVSGIFLHIVHHIFCRHPLGIISSHHIPHDYLVGAVQPPVLALSHPAMRWTEEMGVDDVIRLVGVEHVGDDTMLEGTDMIKGMVTYLMPLCYNLVVEIVVAQYVFAHHEEGSLDIVLSQGFQDEWGGFGNRTIIECEIHRMVVLVHSPYCFRI